MNELNNPYPDDPVYSRKVIDMLTVANEFCRFIEKADDVSGEELMRYLQKIFPLIYIKASLLPDVNAEDEEATEHFVTGEEWENLFNKLRQKLGNDDTYYIIDHHEKTNQDAIRASLAENLADIYQDLKDFVLLYQKPLKISKENAVKDCKYLFETRFGYRVVNAHGAIHYLIYKEGEKGEMQDFMESL